MKLQMATLLLSFTLGVSVQAQTSVPADYNLNCWDHTFAYNRMDIQARGDQLQFDLSGANLTIFQNLITTSTSWGSLRATFSVDKKNCFVSPTDAKILTCQAEPLTIHMEDLNSVPVINQDITVKSVTIQTRMVQEMAIWGNTTAGYELQIAESSPIDGLPIFIQRYFDGLASDASSNCVLK